MTDRVQPAPPGDVSPAQRTDTLHARVRHAANLHLDQRRRAALRLLLSFIVSFGLLRAVTYAIHNHVGPFHDVVVGGQNGVHIHHYMWGLLLLIVAGFLAICLEATRWHARLAILLGIGTALVLDEFAILLELKDVYWADDGRWSVDVALLVAAALLLYYLGQRFWNQVAAEAVWAARRLSRGERWVIGRFRHRHADARALAETRAAGGGPPAASPHGGAD